MQAGVISFSICPALCPVLTIYKFGTILGIPCGVGLNYCLELVKTSYSEHAFYIYTTFCRCQARSRKEQANYVLMKRNTLAHA